METASLSSEEKPPGKPRTAAQREASRRNGRKSKGPKTREGKTRSARNACRHGLTVSALVHPAFRRQVTQFAQEIAGANADAEDLVLSTRIAAAYLDMQRANRVAAALLCDLPSDPFLNQDTLERAAAIKFRYEYRSLSRRYKAIRELDQRRLAALDRAQQSKTNPALAGALEAALEHDPAVDKTNLTTGTGASDNGAVADWAKRTRADCLRSSPPPASWTETCAVGATTQRTRLPAPSHHCRAEGRLAERTQAVPGTQRNTLWDGSPHSGAKSCRSSCPRKRAPGQCRRNRWMPLIRAPAYQRPD